MAQQVQGQPDLEGFTEAERQVLARALDKDSAHRYPSCGEFIRELRRAATPPPAPPAGGAPVPPGRRRGRWKAIGYGAVLAVPLALLAALGLGQRPPVSCPEGCVKADGASFAEVDGKRYWDQVVHTGITGEPIRFRLIGRSKADDPPSFYLMETKVTRAQFHRAMSDPRMGSLLAERSAGHPWAVQGKWQETQAVAGDQGPLPVFDVTVTEAHCFAELLGGRLPTEAQWDKAGGGLDGAEGPYKPECDPKRDIALGLKEPRPVGTSPGEESIFHILDMAGNGREFTRELQDPGPRRRTVPLSDPDKDRDRVILRGHSFLRSRPFKFPPPGEGRPQVLEYGESRGDVGFRVVLELPVGR
jgi:hypothetical protein